jgi:hypothetical protein
MTDIFYVLAEDAAFGPFDHEKAKEEADMLNATLGTDDDGEGYCNAVVVPLHAYLETLAGQRLSVWLKSNIVYMGTLLRVANNGIVLGMGKNNTPEPLVLAAIRKVTPLTNEKVA